MKSSAQELANNHTFYDLYRGTFVSLMSWSDLDGFWKTLKSQAHDQWFIYAVGEAVPKHPVNENEFARFIDEIDVLLRKEHEEDYCGIVFVDKKDAPTMIKIYDPNNLGVVCGFSDNPPPPGWILSKVAPQPLDDLPPLPRNRRRWWQKVWS